MYITHRFSLDCQKTGAQKYIQGPVMGELNARRCVISLTQNGEPIEIPDDGTYVAVMRKAGSSATPCTIENGSIVYDFQQADLNTKGVILYQLEVILASVAGNQQAIYSPSFNVEIAESDAPFNYDPLQYTALEAAIAKAQMTYNKGLKDVSVNEDGTIVFTFNDDTQNSFDALCDVIVQEAEREQTFDNMRQEFESWNEAEIGRENAEVQRATAEYERVLAESRRESRIENIEGEIENLDGRVTYLEEHGGGGSADVPIATTDTAGKVKPDGTSITVEEDGTIHAVGGGGGGGDVPIATTSTAGKVKPDGTSITVESDGTIHAVGSGANEIIISETEPSPDEEWEVYINPYEPIGVLEVDKHGKNVLYQNILDTDGTNGNGEAMLWDEIDRAWVYFTKRPPYDANKTYNYACIAKRTEDGKIIYTAQTIFNGTDFPVKSGGIKVTDIKRWSNYYLVTVRSGEPNVPSDGVDNTSIWGYLIILNANDLTVNSSASFNAKCSNVNVVGTRYPQGESQCFICISCQMSYFQVAKLTVSEGQVTINLRNKTYFKAFAGTSYTDIHTDIQEFQQGKMYFSKDMKTKLLINAGFGWGIHIVDFSSVASTGKYTAIYNYNWQDHFDVVGQDYSPVGSSARAGSTFELAINYPYVYATFAQPTEVIEAYNTTGIDCRVQGVLILDISDLNNIVGKLVKIPLEDCQTNTSGDPKPCTMEMYENEIYLGMGDRGIARFIADGMNLTYKGLINVGKMRNVKPVRVDDSGNLMCRNSSGVPSFKYYDTSKYEMTLINLASVMEGDADED